MVVDDPGTLEWLVSRARASDATATSFSDDLLAHLMAVGEAHLVAISFDPGTGDEVFRYALAAPAGADQVETVRALIDAADEGKCTDVFLHRFRHRMASGTVVVRPAGDRAALAERLEPALHLLDLLCELDRAKDEASHDPLTGLWNRRAMNLALGRAIAEGNRYADRTFAVAMIDLDHFKWFNDSYGHPVGDELLRELARVVAGTIRTSDLASRWGGDEFLLLFPETPPEDLAVVFERVTDELQGFLGRYGRENVRVSFSSGVSYFPADGTDADTLIRRADERLYQAKQQMPPQPRFPDNG